VPHSGPVILASNHTTGIDAPVIQAHCLRTVRWLMLESYRMRFAEPLWRTIRPVFLDKGSSDLNKLRELVAVLKEGDVIGLFPEGVLQRERRVLAPLKPGVGMIARRSHAAIVPVWIADTPKTRSMLWHFLRPSRSKVLFGPAFTPGKEMSVDEVVAELHRRLTALAILAQDMGSDAPIPAALQAPAQAN